MGAGRLLQEDTSHSWSLKVIPWGILWPGEMTCETPLHYLQPQAWLLLGCCEAVQPKFGSLGCWVLALQICRAPTQGDSGQSLFLEVMRAQLFSNVQIASLTPRQPPSHSNYVPFLPFLSIWWRWGRDHFYRKEGDGGGEG